MSVPIIHIGLKYWSVNTDVREVTRNLWRRSVFSFIELYTVPGSYRETISIWKSFLADDGIPFIIHAPHLGHGVNFSRSDWSTTNQTIMTEARRWADDLRADNIIIHPGVNGRLKESVRQIRQLREPRLLTENMPLYGHNDAGTCLGSTPEEIETISRQTDCGVCLDYSHAAAAAYSHGEDLDDIIRRFCKLRPSLLHLSDGFIRDHHDRHLPLSEGNYPLPKWIRNMPEDARLTLETPKGPNLNRFESESLWIDRLRRYHQVENENVSSAPPRVHTKAGHQ